VDKQKAAMGDAFVFIFSLFFASVMLSPLQNQFFVGFIWQMLRQL
jgi:hypothetical protein